MGSCTGRVTVLDAGVGLKAGIRATRPGPEERHLEHSGVAERLRPLCKRLTMGLWLSRFRTST